MRGYTLLLSFLILPVLGALGHDIYITYKDQNFDKPMMFSDVGYLWTHYSPETYDLAHQSLAHDTWLNIITPLLEQMTVVVSAVPFVLSAIILLILKLLRLPPFSDGARVGSFKKKGFGFGSGDKKQGKFKYNRK